MKKKVAVVDGEDDSDDNETPKATTINRSTALKEEVRVNLTALHMQGSQEPVSQIQIPNKSKLTAKEDSNFKKNQQPPQLEVDQGQAQLKMRLNALSLLLQENHKKVKPFFFLRDYAKKKQDSTPNAVTPSTIVVKQLKHPVFVTTSIKGVQECSSSCAEHSSTTEDDQYPLFSYSGREEAIYNLWRENMSEIHARTMQKTVKIADKINNELVNHTNLIKHARQSIQTCFNSVATVCYPALHQRLTPN
ncbi:hypothetical protein LSM04_005678 [Trypanosoma melophagium]|uniref:uncharacterized protein n=1 Tax=Trypanosoma melophagium TaxID=715481 RepID=UPI003519FACB|nr:hypothetical protein LSM04_005678 [Trypanosoma melophagium]